MNNYYCACPLIKQETGTVRKDISGNCRHEMTKFPENPGYSMAYVAFQTDNSTYDEMKALRCGTLFPVLNMPFLGSGRR